MFASQISVTVVENSISAVYLTFKNVVIEKIPYLSEELLRILRLIVEDKSDDFKIDPNRMKTVIDRFVLKQLLALEKEPQTEITHALISNVLYGNSQTDVRINYIEILLKSPTFFANVFFIQLFRCSID